MLYEVAYHDPKTKKELLQVLADQGAAACVLAGGTDLVPNIRAGWKRPQALIDIKRIPEHQEMVFRPSDGLTIGPAVTITQLTEDPTVHRRFPVLMAAAHELASVQVRNRATVVGNICNASPCADMATALLCLGAKVVLTSRKGRRELTLKEFIVGVKKTVMRPDEYCEKIVVPPDMADARGGHKKLKRVKGHDIALVSVSMVKAGRLLRVAVGSAAPTAVVLKDMPASTPADRVCAEAVKTIRPIDDVRCSAEYRVFMAQVYIRRLLGELK